MEHPKIYLGDQFGNMIVYGAEFWYVSAEKYIKAAVENVNKISKNLINAYQIVAKPPSYLAIGQKLTLRPILNLKG